MDELAATCSAAIRDAVKARFPGVQVVLDGMLVVETLESDETDPVIRTVEIGNPAPWTKLGYLRASTLEAEQQLLDNWIPDEGE